MAATSPVQKSMVFADGSLKESKYIYINGKPCEVVYKDGKPVYWIWLDGSKSGGGSGYLNESVIVAKASHGEYSWQAKVPTYIYVEHSGCGNDTSNAVEIWRNGERILRTWHYDGSKGGSQSSVYRYCFLMLTGDIVKVVGSYGAWARVRVIGVKGCRIFINMTSGFVEVTDQIKSDAPGVGTKSPYISPTDKYCLPGVDMSNAAVYDVFGNWVMNITGQVSGKLTDRGDTPFSLCYNEENPGKMNFVLEKKSALIDPTLKNNYIEFYSPSDEAGEWYGSDSFEVISDFRQILNTSVPPSINHDEYTSGGVVGVVNGQLGLNGQISITTEPGGRYPITRATFDIDGFVHLYNIASGSGDIRFDSKRTGNYFKLDVLATDNSENTSTMKPFSFFANASADVPNPGDEGTVSEEDLKNPRTVTFDFGDTINNAFPKVTYPSGLVAPRYRIISMTLHAYTAKDGEEVPVVLRGINVYSAYAGIPDDEHPMFTPS